MFLLRRMFQISSHLNDCIMIRVPLICAWPCTHVSVYLSIDRERSGRIDTTSSGSFCPFCHVRKGKCLGVEGGGWGEFCFLHSLPFCLLFKEVLTWVAI